MSNWKVDYEGGFDDINLNDFIIYNQNRFWINDKTGERISNEEFIKRYSNKDAVESYRVDILNIKDNDKQVSDSRIS